MGEENKTDKNEIKKSSLLTFIAVSKFKSVNRAIRRGHVSIYGHVYPNRPFNNRTAKKNSRLTNEVKKRIYEQLKSR